MITDIFAGFNRSHIEIVELRAQKNQLEKQARLLDAKRKLLMEKLGMVIDTVVGIDAHSLEAAEMKEYLLIELHNILNQK